MRIAVVTLACAAALLLGGCSTYLQDLNRAEQHYLANEHERALALFRAVEPDMDSLDHVDRIRYCYLRGMTDYRLGAPFRADARHWLALARALEEDKPGGLKPEWKEKLEDALKDLNQDVYGTGSADVPKEGEKQAAKSESKDASDKSSEKTDDKSEGDSKPKSKKCKGDDDCPGELVCVNGACKKK